MIHLKVRRDNKMIVREYSSMLSNCICIDTTTGRRELCTSLYIRCNPKNSIHRDTLIEQVKLPAHESNQYSFEYSTLGTCARKIKSCIDGMVLGVKIRQEVELNLRMDRIVH